MTQFFIQRGFRQCASKPMPVVFVFGYWIKFHLCKLALVPFSFPGHWGGKFTVEPKQLYDAEFIADGRF